MKVLGIDPGLGNTGYGIVSAVNNNFEFLRECNKINLMINQNQTMY